MTTTQDEHTGLQAIEVSTETTINHYRLGLSAASDWDNAEQGEFLLGMADGFAELKGAGHMQLHYIVHGAPEASLRAIRHFVDLLHEYFAEAAK